LYHWMDSNLYDPNHADYDPIIAGKKAYFNIPFFWGRALVYMGIFVYFTRYFRKWSLKEDETGGTDIHYLMYRKSAVFLVFFAVFSSTMAWDWLMSIDTHWYSTMYGWYIFSGMWVTTMTFATLLTIWLKKHGYLASVNNSHIHDMGKWMFAVSMLWRSNLFQRALRPLHVGYVGHFCSELCSTVLCFDFTRCKKEYQFANPRGSYHIHFPFFRSVYGSGAWYSSRSLTMGIWRRSSHYFHVVV
jgi:hypothetical protein